MKLKTFVSVYTVCANDVFFKKIGTILFHAMNNIQLSMVCCTFVAGMRRRFAAGVKTAFFGGITNLHELDI